MFALLSMVYIVYVERRLENRHRGYVSTRRITACRAGTTTSSPFNGQPESSSVAVTRPATRWSEMTRCDSARRCTDCHPRGAHTHTIRGRCRLQMDETFPCATRIRLSNRDELLVIRKQLAVLPFRVYATDNNAGNRVLAAPQPDLVSVINARRAFERPSESSVSRQVLRSSAPRAKRRNTGATSARSCQ